jgi:predicted ribosome quality control (RQC) complex YloA/Tae2 family protein
LNLTTVHLNYFFLRNLAIELTSALSGARLEEVFTQEREELVLSLRLAGGAQFYIRAFLRAELTYLHFPAEYNRARANTASLFQDAYGLSVLDVQAVPYDRSLYITLQNNYTILFKLHGNRSNIALLNPNRPIALFKSKLERDAALSLAVLTQAPDLSFERFKALNGNPYKFLPQIGVESVAYLNENYFAELVTVEEKWTAFSAHLALLESPTHYFVSLWQGKTQLLLFPAGTIEKTTESAMEAARFYGKAISQRFYLEAEMRNAIALVARRKEQTVAYLGKLAARKHALEGERPPAQLADLIMAQLHKFKPTPEGTLAAELEDYYTGGTQYIELKPGQTPQIYGTQLYRKARNASQELERLAAQAESRTELLLRLEQAAIDLPDLTDVRALRARVASLGPEVASSPQNEESLPFRQVEFQGWRIRIGRSATANDAMLRGFTHKNDIWLHAKDVSGSHVIICQRPGLPLPKPVLEAAASVAAFHSKQRTQTLATVAYTERKYVRKIKGTPPGAVRVERESSIMVAPKDIK